MKVIASLISWIFLPLLAPVYALCVAMFIPSFAPDFFQRNSLYFLDFEARKILLYLFGFFSFLAPSLTILFLQTRGLVSNVMLDNRKERVLPSFLVIIYGVSLFVILNLKIPLSFPGAVFLYGLSLGSLISVVICSLITLKWKVSLHATGMGILSGFVFYYYANMLFFQLPVLLTLFLLSGIVMSARMYLKLHTLNQLLIGYSIGFIGTILGIFLIDVWT